jgi:hypothetical protein
MAQVNALTMKKFLVFIKKIDINKLKLSKTHIAMVLPTVAHLMLFNNKRKLNHCHEFVKNKQMSDA